MAFIFGPKAGLDAKSIAATGRVKPAEYLAGMDVEFPVGVYSRHFITLQSWGEMAAVAVGFLHFQPDLVATRQQALIPDLLQNPMKAAGSEC